MWSQKNTELMPILANEIPGLFPFTVNPDKKSMGIPHNGFAMMVNSSKPLRIALAMGESLPNAVMNAIKNTTIQTAMNIATAHKPRFKFLLISSMSFRVFLSLYSVPIVVF
jgi:hypothetical protein